MRVIARHAVGEDPDVLAFDPSARRLYVASESGTVTVFAEQKGGLVREGDVSISHAHTVAVDPRTHLVYLPLQDVDGHPLLQVIRPRP
jgi:DNA-binding beta-propeller fold protein YncE